MINFGFFLLLFQIRLATTHQNNITVFGELGETVKMSCSYHSQMAMHFSWYKHQPRQNPMLISTIYKYEDKATFYHSFKEEGRFSVLHEKGAHYLVIKNLQFTDSATYYCGSAYSNVLEFVQGTELIVGGLQIDTAIQQHISHFVQPGESVNLQCTVLSQSCKGDRNVYWLIHKSQESRPKIISTHRSSIDQCEWSPGAGSKVHKCVYNFSKTNLSLHDSGIYYCAVAACGEILFGNGTRLDIGVDSTEQMTIFVLLSIVRALLLLVTVATLIFWYYMKSKRMARAGCSPPSGKTFREKHSRPERK